jgi:hypothetical protein
VLETDGGFSWWYVDLVDTQGNGAVLIWAFGLPFLPGYLACARAGTPQRPVNRPSLSLALYEGGRQVFYVLAEQEPADASWLGGSFRFGRSRIEVTTCESRVEVRASIDADLPLGERVVGELVASGQRVAHQRLDLGFGPVPLVWEPIATGGCGRYALETRTASGHTLWQMAAEGLSAYLDHNRGDVPLDRYGIERWIWGRVTLPSGQEQVYFLLEPEDHTRPPTAIGLEIRDGRVHERALSVRSRQQRRGWFGMRWDRSLELVTEAGRWLSVTHDAPYEDGPFYLRMRARAQAPDGVSGQGTAEVVCPARIDRAAMRPLVRMRVQPPAGTPSSIWSPLFLGSRLGRWERTLRSLNAAARSRPSAEDSSRR